LCAGDAQTLACSHGGANFRQQSGKLRGCPFVRQNLFQAILENVERAGEQVERAFGLGRIVAITGQHFDPLALARNNSPPNDDVAKSHFRFAPTIVGPAIAKGRIPVAIGAGRRTSPAAHQARRITMSIAGSCSNFSAAFSIASRSSAASISPSLMDFGKAG
jgi:hypothetical protein